MRSLEDSQEEEYGDIVRISFMRNPNKIRLANSELVYQVFITVFVSVVALCCLFPLLYVLGISFASEGELIQKNNFVIFPTKPTVSAYAYIIKQSNFTGGMLITIIRTALGVVAALILALPGGYILAKKDLPHKFLIIQFFIITMIVNGGLIPNYILIKQLDLIDRFWVLVLPYLGNTFGMLVIKIFVENIPVDLIESAELDGASEVMKIKHIAIPLLVPTLCALGLFAAVNHWNFWFDAMIYIRDPNKFPLQLIVRNLLMKSDINETVLGTINLYQRMSSQSLKMAAVVVAMTPILCVYPFLQKYFIYGIYSGSVKE